MARSGPAFCDILGGMARLSSAATEMDNDVLLWASCHAMPVTALQNEYNLVHREQYEGAIQQLCVERDIASLPYFGLASGFLTGKYRSTDDFRKSARGNGMERFFQEGLPVLAVMDDIARDTGASHSAIALAWIIAQPGIHTTTTDFADTCPLRVAKTPPPAPKPLAQEHLRVRKPTAKTTAQAPASAHPPPSGPAPRRAASKTRWTAAASHPNHPKRLLQRAQLQHLLSKAVEGARFTVCLDSHARHFRSCEEEANAPAAGRAEKTAAYLANCRLVSMLMLAASHVGLPWTVLPTAPRTALPDHVFLTASRIRLQLPARKRATYTAPSTAPSASAV